MRVTLLVLLGERVSDLDVWPPQAQGLLLLGKTHNGPTASAERDRTLPGAASIGADVVKSPPSRTLAGSRVLFLCSQVTPDWVTADHPVGPHAADAAVQGKSRQKRTPSHRTDLEGSGGDGIVTETYEIALRGEPGPVTRAAFPEFELRCEEGLTLLQGEFVDQAELHGVLERANSLGLVLVNLRLIADDSLESSSRDTASGTFGSGPSRTDRPVTTHNQGEKHRQGRRCVHLCRYLSRRDVGT